MKKALVTMAMSSEYKYIGETLTFPPMKAYCAKYGLDFVNIDHCKREHDRMRAFEYAAWERLIWMYELLEEYDRVIMAEVDVIVAKDARDVLELLPEGVFYGFDEALLDRDRCELFLRGTEMEQHEKRARQQTIMYNSGAFICDKIHRPIFKPAINENARDMLEMSLMNLRITGFDHKDVSPDVINLSHEWESGTRPGKPDFLHVMWSKKWTKHDEIERLMGRMGW
jgi:hypothetical protein